MKKIRDVNYLALDLELNKDDQTDQTTKIIQVGIAVGSPRSPNEIKTWSWYINPNEKISPFITKLTGITDQMVTEGATPLHLVAEEMHKIMLEYKTFVNPIQWGLGDADELKKTFKEGGIHFPHFGRRVFDVKTAFLFLEMANGRSPAGGLSSSMGKYKIPFQGEPHRADADALNTLRFFFHLLERQETLEVTIGNLKEIKY